METAIEITVPLPPVSLRANSRAHWATKKRDADRYSEDVFDEFMFRYGHDETDSCRGCTRLWDQKRRGHCPWKAAKVTYTWRYCGAKPDVSNVAGSTKALQDIICMAPANGAGKDRWYLGLIENDREIVPEYKLEKVAHRSEEGVLIKITRIDDAEKENT